MYWVIFIEAYWAFYNTRTLAVYKVVFIFYFYSLYFFHETSCDSIGSLGTISNIEFVITLPSHYKKHKWRKKFTRSRLNINFKCRNFFSNFSIRLGHLIELDAERDETRIYGVRTRRTAPLVSVNKWLVLSQLSFIRVQSSGTIISNTNNSAIFPRLPPLHLCAILRD